MLIFYTDCVLISSETNDAGRLTYPTNENYKHTTSYSSGFTKSTSDSPTTNHMSIIFTKSSPTIMTTSTNNGNTVIQASTSSSRAQETIECTGMNLCKLFEFFINIIMQYAGSKNYLYIYIY